MAGCALFSPNQIVALAIPACSGIARPNECCSLATVRRLRQTRKRSLAAIGCYAECPLQHRRADGRLPPKLGYSRPLSAVTIADIGSSQHYRRMKVPSLVCELVLLASLPAGAQVSRQETSVLVISLPGIPNPPKHDQNAGQLYRGTWRWIDQKGQPAPVEPVRAFSEAALGCGKRRFQWQRLNYDHGNELVIANDRASQRALACIARKVPFDFYVRVERTNVVR